MNVAAPFRSLDVAEKRTAAVSAAPAAVNSTALLSLLCVSSFLAYFFIPHSDSLMLNMAFVVLLPIAGFAFSVISLRQIAETSERGSLMSFFALTLTLMYFLTALAIPFVLLSCYVVYTYVL